MQPTARSRRSICTTGKVTIKHGEIKHMDMPGMTMVFTAKDKKSLLAKVKPGNKVKFHGRRTRAGEIVVTDIQPAQHGEPRCFSVLCRRGWIY